MRNDYTAGSAVDVDGGLLSCSVVPCATFGFCGVHTLKQMGGCLFDRLSCCAECSGKTASKMGSSLAVRVYYQSAHPDHCTTNGGIRHLAQFLLDRQAFVLFDQASFEAARPGSSCLPHVVGGARNNYTILWRFASLSRVGRARKLDSSA